MVLLWYLTYIFAIPAGILLFRVKFTKFHERLFYSALFRVVMRQVQAFRVVMSRLDQFRVAWSARQAFRVAIRQVQTALEHLFYSRALEKNERKTPSSTNIRSIRIVIFYLALVENRFRVARSMLVGKTATRNGPAQAIITRNG